MKTKHSFNIALTIFALFTGSILHAQQALAANTPATININNGQRVQLSFTAPSAGEYRFESSNNGSLDPVAYSAASGSGSTVVINDDSGSGTNFRFTRNLSAGEVFTFFAGVHSDRGNGSYTVNVQGTASQAANAPPPVALAANALATVDISRGVRVQVSFTAPQAGDFIFESTSNGSLNPVAFSAASGTTSAVTIDNNSGEGNNFRFTRTLRAGEVFTFFAGVLSNTGNGSYSVGVFRAGGQLPAQPAAQTTVSAGITLSVNSPLLVNINSGRRMQVSFTAPSAGNFTFESTNNGSLDPVSFVNSPETFGATRNTIIDDDSGNGNNFRFTRDLRSGEVFTFFAGVRNDRGNGTYTVSVQAMQLTALAANTPTTININNGQRVLVSFTAPQAGNFIIESVNNGSSDPVAFSSSSGGVNIDNNSGGNRNFLFARNFRAGETFTFFSGVHNDRGNGSYAIRIIRIVVAPMTQTKWNQGSPYNDLIPMVGGRRVTDCGNLALAKILHYHQYPVRGNGQSTRVRINSDSVTVPTVNFNVAYDWGNMLNNYTTANPGNAQQRNAVATLLYHVSAAVGSKTPERSNYPNNYVAALTDVFGYNAQVYFRSSFNDAQWEAMIRQQLDSGLPVYYWGRRTSGSHAFVVDGYDSSGRFHINWGWSGNDNGWYTLNNLNPPSTGHYNTGHLIITMRPARR